MVGNGNLERLATIERIIKTTARIIYLAIVQLDIGILEIVIQNRICASWATDQNPSIFSALCDGYPNWTQGISISD